MINSCDPYTVHSYICKFSREHNIGSMTYENMLCKAYVVCKRIGIFEENQKNNSSVRRVKPNELNSEMEDEYEDETEEEYEDESDEELEDSL